MIDIIKGHINELLGTNKSLSQKRLEICERCPIYSPKFEGWCNPNLWLNPKTNEIAFKPTPGFIKGCGCRLKAKTTLDHNHCVVGKW